ncbi:pentapeptide repeat-containing protein [Streptosporangium algeriense]|uniref:Pentapeptide repeat-containing protein n=1 Tax=Streptosporangium algeriense TaxID=1682748 RepID=A0ABW3DLW9_9ACTN
MRLPARLPRLRRRISAAPAELATPDLLSGIAEPVVPPPLRTPRAAAWWIVPAALLVGGAATAMAWWLLSSLPLLPTTAEEATARQGAIQTALAVAAGIGAAITLMLAFRRQRHQEHAAHVTAYLAERNAQLTEQIAERNARLAEQVAEHNRQDATERRVTELYTKAVEQLGHTTAAVRLGGLYALERLAQDNPAHRQTIVNVICAYLRMPYTPPFDTAQQDPVHAVPRAAVAGASATPTGHNPHEERQVRLTAQRILSEHLRYDRTLKQSTVLADSRFWEGMNIDLTGAILTDLDFTGCRIADAWFEGVRFKGKTKLGWATFGGNVGFGGAVFEDDIWFRGVLFGEEARFVGVTFKGEASFSKVTFEGEVWFGAVAFRKDAYFGDVTFKEEVGFDGSAFLRGASFNDATFKGEAYFGHATFKRGVHFEKVTFERDAWFGEATFEGKVLFDDVQALRPDNEHCWPVGWIVVRQKDGSGLLRRENAKPPSLSSSQ